CDALSLPLRRAVFTPGRLASIADFAIDALELRMTTSKGRHQRRIELSRRLQDGGDRALMRQGRLVQALAAQGIVDVGQGGQSRRRRNRLADQAIGIAGPVEALM